MARGVDGAVAFICYEGKGRPKPALPKTCTTLVPRGTIEAGTDLRYTGMVLFARSCYEGKGRPKPALPKACTTLAPNGYD